MNAQQLLETLAALLQSTSNVPSVPAQAQVKVEEAVTSGPTGLTSGDVKLNEGIVRGTEIPLWVGDSPFTEAKRMSVTSGKLWLWVRFDKPLSPAHHAHLLEHGGNYSKKKRLAYWFDTEKDPKALEFVRGLGPKNLPAPTVNDVVPSAPAKSASTKTAAPAKTGTGKGSKSVASSKRKYSLHEIGYKSNGRPYSLAHGWFVSPDDIDFTTHPQGTAPVQTTPSVANAMNSPYMMGFVIGQRDRILGHPSVPESGFTGTEDVHYRNGYVSGYGVPDTEAAFEQEVESEDGEMIAYDQGFEDGVYDAENDAALPGIYTRLALAKHLGITVQELERRNDSDYLDGWMAGFASIRPMVKARGIKAQMSAK